MRAVPAAKGDARGIHRMAHIMIRPGGDHRLPALGLDADGGRQIRVFPKRQKKEVERTQQQNCSRHLEPARHLRPAETDGIEPHQDQPGQKEHLQNHEKHFIPGRFTGFAEAASCAPAAIQGRA